MMSRGAGEGVLLVVLGGVGGCAAEGLETTSSEQEIIGGTSSGPGAYPATGALLQGWTYRCTATLIAPDVVLTAAHCLEEGGFGDLAFTLDRDLTDGHDDLVKLIIRHQHPQYSRDLHKPQGTGLVHDIGIGILERPIEGVPYEIMHTGNLGPDVTLGDPIQVCGYGVDVWFVRASVGIKRDAMLHIDEVAEQELRTMAADPQPCQGDSGGPLLRDTPVGRRLVGIVVRSAGDSYKCDEGAIATRVAPYVSWIEEATEQRDMGCSVGRGRGTLPVAGLLAAVLFVSRAGRRRPS
jgi:hypothetical protein